VTQVRDAMAHDDAKHTHQDDSCGAMAYDEAKHPHQDDVLARVNQAYHRMAAGADEAIQMGPSTGTSLQEVPTTELTSNTNHSFAPDRPSITRENV